MHDSKAVTPEEYLLDFPEGIRAKALKHALDIRKFEIDLYWKRATYFWGFIAAAFAAYFVISQTDNILNLGIVECLGFLFSLSWYLVNRGSGAWQRNWEAHVDLLEDALMGPLYKTVISRGDYKFVKLASPYPFSPSRINNILSLTVTGVWFAVICMTVIDRFGDFSGTIELWVFGFVTIASAFLLIWKGQAQRDGHGVLVHRRQIGGDVPSKDLSK